MPTPKGQELARSLAEAFDIMAAACRRLQQSDAGPALTIAACPPFATIWLIPRLSQFFRDHPEISVKVIYAFAGQKIDFDEVDIAILWGPGEWEGCRATRLPARQHGADLQPDLSRKGRALRRAAGHPRQAPAA